MKKRWKIVGLALLALGLLYMHQHHHITLEQVLNWQPENLILAAVALLCYLLVSRFELSTNRIIPSGLVYKFIPVSLLYDCITMSKHIARLVIFPLVLVG